MAASAKTKETVWDITLLITRLGSSTLMLTHGWPKLMKLIEGGEIKFADPLGIGEMPSLVLTTFAEVLCAVLVGIGLKTRLAAIPLLITMITVAFVVHSGDPIRKSEASLLYLIIYLVILVKGAGKFSFDYMVFGKK